MVDGIEPGNHDMIITNILGETIRKESVKMTGSIVYELDLTDLPEGVYFMKMGDINKKIIKK
jgi:hypothetical protein